GGGVGTRGSRGRRRRGLGGGLREGLEGRPRQFELSARLERNRTTAGDVVQPDDVAALHDRLPAEQQLHALEQRPDAAIALVRHGIVAIERERRFLVLGADAKLLFRLFARGDPGDEFIARSQRRRIGLVTGHVFSLKLFSLEAVRREDAPIRSTHRKGSRMEQTSAAQRRQTDDATRSTPY